MRRPTRVKKLAQAMACAGQNQRQLRDLGVADRAGRQLREIADRCDGAEQPERLHQDGVRDQRAILHRNVENGQIDPQLLDHSDANPLIASAMRSRIWGKRRRASMIRGTERIWLIVPGRPGEPRPTARRHDRGSRPARRRIYRRSRAHGEAKSRPPRSALRRGGREREAQRRVRLPCCAHEG